MVHWGTWVHNHYEVQASLCCTSLEHKGVAPPGECVILRGCPQKPNSSDNTL